MVSYGGAVLRCGMVLWWTSAQGDVVSRCVSPDTGRLDTLPNRHPILYSPAARTTTGGAVVLQCGAVLWWISARGYTAFRCVFIGTRCLEALPNGQPIPL